MITGRVLFTFALLVASLLVTSFACAQTNSDDPTYRVHVRHAPGVEKELVNRLSIKGIAGVARDGQNIVELTASGRDYVILKLMRLPNSIVENAAPLEQKLSEGKLSTGFHTLDAINKILFSTEAQYPEIAKVVDVGKDYGVGNTYENRPMYALKISDNVSADEDEPNVLIVALLNAREIANPEIVLETIRKLTEEYTSDETIRSIVDANEIFLAPVWNPGQSHFASVSDYLSVVFISFFMELNSIGKFITVMSFLEIDEICSRWPGARMEK
eukprot:TRINITY_DN4124_c0_g2_i1.p1 TRINITY_DN4124_c0_g2~~TRINITY_DN4124_c0_g2_i1.p1  ORF type:complete len:272 (-),score=36.35 TRINITY_DN4124_c0_g2_i1:1148-1963(-)